jgi:hypothetical protein
LNPDLIVSTINLDSLTIGSIIQKSTKLVLRFNEYTCDVCVRDEISALEGIAKVIGKENIIVISSFSRIRDFISFKKLNQIPYSCYNLCKSNLGLDIEKLNHPFLFVLDDDFITKLVFIPETNISFVQTDYFNIIINRFFRNN